MKFLAQDSLHLIKSLVAAPGVEETQLFNSGAVEMQAFTGASIQYVFSDSDEPLSGTLKVQESNDGTNWVDINSASASIIGNGSGVITVKDIYSDKIRVQYTALVGETTLNCYVQAKEK